MRIFKVILMTLALLCGLRAAQAQSAFGEGGDPHIAARLAAETTMPRSGEGTSIAFDMKPERGWHGYWQNPGDAGLGMTVDWTLPKGVSVGALRYPVPETLLIAGLMNHVYEGPYAILADLKIARDIAPGTRLPIRAKAQWLACTDKVCVPESGTLALDLVAGDGQATSADRARFDGWRTHLPRPLGSEATYAIKEGKLRLSVPFPASAQASDVHLFPLAEGFAIYAAPQTVSREGDRLILETAAADGGKGGTVQAVLRTGDHVGFLITATAGDVVGASAATRVNWGAILAALGGALLGGLILNIMPCVFPILGLKAMSLARAGGDERAVRREALAYTAGVIATCLALGGILLALRAAGTAAGWAFQLQDPRIILFLLLLVTAIAFNLAGLFELHNIGGGEKLAGKGGVAGSFWTGALVAFVATPCTGPFMAAAMGAALVLPVAAALAVFAGLGLGLALPFLLLGWLPALRARMPRPGAWMGRVQKILSIPMFITAVGLAWLLGQQRGVSGMTLGLFAAVILALLLWWLGRRQLGGRSGGLAVASAALVLLVGTMLILPADAVKTDNAATVQFSVAQLEKARASGKPVFLYFTADWCLTCKANEAAAIDRAETQAAFDRAGVQVIVGDWTNADPAITRFLESQGRSGVPLYLWYAPGSAKPQVLPQLLTPATLTALAS